MNKFMKYGNMFVAIASPMFGIAEFLRGDLFHFFLYAMLAMSAIIDWNRFDD